MALVGFEFRRRCIGQIVTVTGASIKHGDAAHDCRHPSLASIGKNLDHRSGGDDRQQKVIIHSYPAVTAGWAVQLISVVVVDHIFFREIGAGYVIAAMPVVMLMLFVLASPIFPVASLSFFALTFPVLTISPRLLATFVFPAFMVAAFLFTPLTFLPFAFLVFPIPSLTLLPFAFLAFPIPPLTLLSLTFALFPFLALVFLPLAFTLFLFAAFLFVLLRLAIILRVR